MRATRPLAVLRSLALWSLPALGSLGACHSTDTSQEKVDAGQRKYCDARCFDTGIDVGGGDGPRPGIDGPVSMLDGEGSATDLPPAPDGPAERVGADGVGESRPPGLDSPVLDAQVDGPPADAGDAAVTTAADVADTTSLAADTKDAKPDGPADAGDAADAQPDAAPEALLDVSADGDVAGADSLDTPADQAPDTASNSDLPPGGTCGLGTSPWGRAWTVATQPPTALAVAADGTPWAAGGFYASFDFGAGTPLAHSSGGSATQPNSDVFLVKLDPATGHASSGFVFSDANASAQSATGVAVASASNLGVIGYFAGEIDFDADSSDGSGPSGNVGTAGVDYLINSASIPYYTVIAGASTGTYATPVLGHMVDVGSGSLLAIAANPSQNAFAICGKTSKAVGKWNASAATKGLITDSAGATAGGGMDIIVAKIDAATGVPIWGHQFGGADNQICESVAIDDSGDVIIAGNYTGTLQFSSTVTLPVSAASGVGLLYVARLAGADGTPIAAATWGTAGITDAFALTTDAGGNLIVAGSLGSNIDFGGGVSLTNAGLTDAFVLKLGSNLTPLWAKAFGDAAKDQTAKTVATAASGDVFVGGNFKGALTGLGLTDSSNGATLDGFVAQLAGSDGTPRSACAKTFGDLPGAQGIGALTVARTASGALADAVLVAGTFASTVTVGSTTLYATGTLACTSGADCTSEPCSPSGFCADPGVSMSFVARLAP